MCGCVCVLVNLYVACVVSLCDVCLCVWCEVVVLCVCV